MGMSLVAQVKNHQILDLLATNPDIVNELSGVIVENSINDLIYEVQEVSFSKRHVIDGVQYKTVVIEKEAFINLTGEFCDASVSDETIAMIEPLICLAPDKTEFYQVKRLETLLSGVLSNVVNDDEE